MYCVGSVGSRNNTFGRGETSRTVRRKTSSSTYEKEKVAERNLEMENIRQKSLVFRERHSLRGRNCVRERFDEPKREKRVVEGSKWSAASALRKESRMAGSKWRCSDDGQGKRKAGWTLSASAEKTKKSSPALQIWLSWVEASRRRVENSGLPRGHAGWSSMDVFGVPVRKLR